MLYEIHSLNQWEFSTESYKIIHFISSYVVNATKTLQNIAFGNKNASDLENRRLHPNLSLAVVMSVFDRHLFKSFSHFFNNLFEVIHRNDENHSISEL